MPEKLETSNLFLQGMWCDMVKLFMLQIVWMILFVSYKQLTRAIWLSFHFMACVPNIYIQVIYCNGGRQSRCRLHGPWCYAGGMMEIMPWHRRWRSNAWRTISYHIIYACDVNPFMHHILLRLSRGSIIRWSLSHKYHDKMCSSIACTVKKVCRFETPCDDRVL
jgi:hypothetical protein